MGGAVGHLSSLTDNRELTFADIKEVISIAGEGRLEKSTEKLDGINIVFTFVNTENELRFARSGGDIKSGGFNAQSLAQKFYGRGNIEEAFVKAYSVLFDAIQTLTLKDRAKIFGGDGSKWYSVEIIYTPSANTINYDSNSIVFHGWPIFFLDKNNKILQSEDDSGIKLLSAKIDQMQTALSIKNWRLRGPSLINMKKLSDGSIVASTHQNLNNIMQVAGVDDNNTLYDYLRSLLLEEIKFLKLPFDLERKVVDRCVEVPEALTVVQLKKLASSKQQQEQISSFVKFSTELNKKLLSPIDNLITQFSIEVLKGIHSTLIHDNEAEIQRLKNQVKKAINTINNSDNEAAKEVLSRELERLKSVDNITTTLEGIVFFYKGQAYKFTGAFAPVHQILSLFTFGRKGIPKLEFTESLNNTLNKLHSHHDILLNENSGKIFGDEVSQITLDEYKTNWKHIVNDLKVLGCNDVVPIGATGKKAVMGDIDVACETQMTREELFQKAKAIYGSNGTKKIGANVVSIKYPIYDNSVLVKHIQVDIMIGDISYLSWARYGTSTDPRHVDYSPLKGVVRNLLLNIVNRFAADIVFSGLQSELDRTKFVVDFDRGLYKVTQTRKNKIFGKPPTKEWRTLKKTFVSDKPDVIAKTIFGKSASASSLKKVEGVIAAVKNSSELEIVANDIFAAFLKEIKELASKNKNVLGHNPKEALAYLTSLIEN